MIELDNLEHETRLEEVHEAEVGTDDTGVFKTNQISRH